MSNFAWNPDAMGEAMRLAGAGLAAATLFVENRVKEVLSVPAPRVAFVGKDGARYYRAGFKPGVKSHLNSPYGTGSRIAHESTYLFPKGGAAGSPRRKLTAYRTAPAIKGDPPRKLSGDLRRSISHEFEFMRTFEGGDVPVKARVGTNIKYAKYLEFHKNRHEFIGRVLGKYMAEIEAIVGSAANISQGAS